MNTDIKIIVFWLSLFCLVGFEKTVMSMQLSNPLDMKDFVKENAHKPYFQELLESIKDPVTSLIMHNRVLEHAKFCVSNPNFGPSVLRELNEGCFKMALRLVYSATKYGKCLDDIDVSVILRRLSNQLNTNAGFVDLEECDQGVRHFEGLLGFILPFLEPLIQKNVKILRISKNHLSNLPGSIRCLHNLEKLCINDNMLTALPVEMTQLPKLCYIDISRNKFVITPYNIAHVKTIINNQSKSKANSLLIGHEESKERPRTKRSIRCKGKL